VPAGLSAAAGILGSGHHLTLEEALSLCRFGCGSHRPCSADQHRDRTAPIRDASPCSDSYLPLGESPARKDTGVYRSRQTHNRNGSTSRPHPAAAVHLPAHFAIHVRADLGSRTTPTDSKRGSRHHPSRDLSLVHPSADDARLQGRGRDRCCWRPPAQIPSCRSRGNGIEGVGGCNAPDHPSDRPHVCGGDWAAEGRAETLPRRAHKPRARRSSAVAHGRASLRALAQASGHAPEVLEVSSTMVRALTIRPSATALLRSRLLTGGGIWLAVLVLELAASAASGRSTFIASLAALAGLTIIEVLAFMYYLRSTWIEVAEDGHVLLSKWGRQLRYTTDEIVGIALRDVRGPGGRAKPLALFYGHHSQCLTVLDRRSWNADDLSRLADTTGVALRQPSHVTNGVAALEREFPGSVPGWRLHSIRTAIISIGVTLAIVITASIVIR
jgi:hypothetical protein